jgi:endoglucanase
MPDEDHASALWSSVAKTFKGNNEVVFDLFSEPYPDNNQDTTAGWTCWKNGGTCEGIAFKTVGMQSLVNTIRNTGASNVLMLGGLEYANRLSHWLQHMPSDPLNNLAASWHIYPHGNPCNSTTC